MQLSQAWGPNIDDDGSDWLGSPDAVDVQDGGSLGPQIDAPVEDVALIEGMDVGGTPPPAGEEEKEIIVDNGVYILIQIHVRRFLCRT